MKAGICPGIDNSACWNEYGHDYSILIELVLGF
jgi:hypothetical protein